MQQKVPRRHSIIMHRIVTNTSEYLNFSFSNDIQVTSVCVWWQIGCCVMLHYCTHGIIDSYISIRLHIYTKKGIYPTLNPDHSTLLHVYNIHYLTSSSSQTSLHNTECDHPP